MKDICIHELVNYILANRKGDAFKDYPPNKIVNEIIAAIKNEVFVFSADNKGNINGVVCGERFTDCHYVVIHDILVTDKGIMKRFMDVYLQRYRDWPLVAKRNGKLVTYYNPTLLERRMK